MDPLALGVVVFVVVLVAIALFSARANRGKPLSAFGGRTPPEREGTRSSGDLEYQDLTEMLAVTNTHRRARGLPERSLRDAIREFGDE